MQRTDLKSFLFYAVEITAYFWVVGIAVYAVAWVGYMSGDGVMESAFLAVAYSWPVLAVGGLTLLYKVVRDAMADVDGDR